MPLSGSLYEIGSFNSKYFLGFVRVAIPLFLIPSTHKRELPSRIGTSSASNSTSTLSISVAKRAAMRCSIVHTLTPFCSKLVPLEVSPTRRASASTYGVFSKSMRLKRMPKSSSAGKRRTFTFLPVCSPLPDISNGFSIVVCIFIMFSDCKDRNII